MTILEGKGFRDLEDKGFERDLGYGYHCSECQRMDAFKLWCWKRLLKVPWPAKRSNQPILRKINTEYLLEGLMLKLKLQYFGHLLGSTDSLMLGKSEGRRRGQQRMRWLDGIINSMDMS